ncbi:ABC transporter substrate-binding protein [Bacillus sp. HMF5848]|uniref:ABC transporter substrate-binding protein n=1 Tax=Bacillus sp. HMF5848 TaxID=2495421 RepID=UPI001639DC60|nr:ABC transporter substrate-binding protein [Bacillus sp. HMF5848]
MKKMLLLMVMALAVVGLAACGGAAEEEKKVLKMGTSADFAPFESRDAEGNFIGFDIELAQYIADELGYELKIEDMKFDGLIGALQTNRVDMVLAGMSATDKRKQNVDFSNPYNHSGEMFVTLSDSPIKSIEDLNGVMLGVQLGTIQEEGAEKINEQYDFEIKKVDNGTTLIQELMSNRIDVAYMDKAVAEGYIAEQNLAGFDDPTSSSPGMAVAFPKDSELVEKVNDILAKAEENGKLEELKNKWLSEEQQ